MNQKTTFLKDFSFAFQTIYRYGRVYYVYIVLDIIIQSVLPLILVIIPKYLLDELITGNFSRAIFWAFSFCLFTLLFDVSSAFISYKKKTVEWKIQERLTENLGIVVMGIPYEKLENKETIDKYEFAVKCIDRNSFTQIGGVFISIISSIITLTGVLFIIHVLPVWMLIFTIFVVIVSAVGEVFRLNYIYERQKTETPIERNLYYARDQLSSKEFAKEVRLFHLIDYISTKVKRYAEELCAVWEKAAWKSLRAVGWTYLLKGVQLFVVNGYIAISCLNGSITIGDFTMLVGAILTLSNASVAAINAIVQLMEEKKYIGHLRQFLSYDVESTVTGTRQSLQSNPTIRFQNVSFRYPNREDYALTDINITLNPGTKYALVGANGAGKTTFIKLLLGLYKPTSGTILVNDVPIDHISTSAYNRLFTTVFQDYQILGFNMEENITLQTNVQRDTIMRCIRDAGLEKTVESLPEGIHTYMSREYADNGVDMSGGERQKLAIARALYKEADIYILDEPTAKLSPQSEFELYENFRRLVHEKTAIFISHRLSSCRLCDQIFVLDCGKLIESGTHDALMRQKGVYAEMFSMQARPYSKGGEEA